MFEVNRWEMPPANMDATISNANDSRWGEERERRIEIKYRQKHGDHTFRWCDLFDAIYKVNTFSVPHWPQQLCEFALLYPFVFFFWKKNDLRFSQCTFRARRERTVFYETAHLIRFATTHIIWCNHLHFSLDALLRLHLARIHRECVCISVVLSVIRMNFIGFVILLCHCHCFALSSLCSALTNVLWRTKWTVTSITNFNFIIIALLTCQFVSRKLRVFLFLFCFRFFISLMLLPTIIEYYADFRCLSYFI